MQPPLRICEQRVFTVSGSSKGMSAGSRRPPLSPNGMDEDRNRDMTSIDLSSSGVR